MKVKFKYAEGSMVGDYEGDKATVDDVICLLNNPKVISLRVTKETQKEYFERYMKEKLEEEELL